MLNDNERAVFYSVAFSSLVHSAMQNLTNFQVELEGKELCLPMGALSFPLPLTLAVNSSIDRKQKLKERLFTILQREEPRIAEYGKVVTPHLWSVYSPKNAYILGKQGFEKVSFEDIIKNFPISSSPRDLANHSDFRDEVYDVVLCAYHQLFSRKFNPDLFKRQPDYALIRGERKNLLKQFTDELRDENPRESQELEELIK